MGSLNIKSSNIVSLTTKQPSPSGSLIPSASMTKQTGTSQGTPRSLALSTSLEKYRTKYQEIKQKANYLSHSDDILLQQFLGLLPTSEQILDKEIKVRFYQLPEPVETVNKKTGQKEIKYNTQYYKVEKLDDGLISFKIVIKKEKQRPL